MVTIKTTFITDVQPLTISGRHTNYTWILERIWIMATNHTQNTYKNRIPGINKYKDRYTHAWVRWRRFNDDDETDYSQEGLNIDDIRVYDIENGQLKEMKLKHKTDKKYSVEKLIEQLKDYYEKLDRDESQSQTSVKKMFDIKNYYHPLFDNNDTKLKTTLGESEINPSFSFENYYDNSIEFIMNSDGKIVKRRNWGASKRTESVQRQQKQKRKELLKFLEHNFQSTNYFYREMKRIIHDRVAVDDLRLMVSELEKRGNEKFRTLILRYYNKLYKAKEKRLYDADFWKVRPNNLIIHEVANPYNDGE